MSAGNFTNTFCQMQSLSGIFWYGQVQPETESFTASGAVNTPPTPSTAPQLVPFKVSKKDGEPGYRPAMVHGYFSGETPPGYKTLSPLRIPALNQAVVAGAIAGINTSSGNSYQGKGFFITGVSMEDLN